MAKNESKEVLSEEKVAAVSGVGAAAGGSVQSIAAAGGALAVGGITFEADAGLGLENADKDSFAIPFLAILQPLSPIVAEGAVEGAKAGLFLNTVTQELASAVSMVPVAFQRRYLRWAPRKLGGGYKGEYSPIDVETGNVEGLVVGEGGRYFIGGTDPDKHDMLKDTRSHFVLLLKPEGGWTPAMISMASTQIKRSKRWLARIQGVQLRGANGHMFNPPSFSHIYTAKSVKESNDQGIWFSWEIDLAGQVQEADLYNAAKAFHAQIVAGKVVTAPPVADDGEASGSGESF